MGSRYRLITGCSYAVHIVGKSFYVSVQYVAPFWCADVLVALTGCRLMLDDVCAWTCGRAWLSVPSRRSSLRCVCEWALLSPLFGEFHRSLPEWHDLLPHSGADWLQYWPYINLVRRKCWQDRQSRHSTEMGRAAEYTTSLADKIFVLNWNYCTAHSTNIFFCPRLTWGCTNYHDWFQTQCPDCWLFQLQTEVNDHSFQVNHAWNRCVHCLTAPCCSLSESSPRGSSLEHLNNLTARTV